MIVSTVKKSVAQITDRCCSMNAPHVRCRLRSGSGVSPASRRMSTIVVRPMSWPRW